MKNKDKITELVEQAASAINLLSPDDTSEVDNLQKLLDEINECISEVSDGPARILEQAKGTTSDAIEVLQQILQKEVQDTTQSVGVVSKAVCSLQKLRQILP